MNYLNIPEIAQSHSTVSVLRIPPELDVPVTDRVLSLIDTPTVRRLAGISQLGLVNLIYPGANHSRLEHSLGVYRNAVLVIRHLAHDPEFTSLIDEYAVKVFLVSALLHDIGHWPMCHAIEDMRMPNIPRHESLAGELIKTGEIAHVLQQQWELAPRDVADFINGGDTANRWPLLCGLLSGPIDIDKMDYLQRDSLHAGVPYGRNFDIHRLIGSLCVGPDQSGIAITEKGKTAAEMMVFSRYVMFSEVYWHHAVRSATAMLQRLVFALSEQWSLSDWLRLSDAQLADQILSRVSAQSPLRPMAEGLFGPRRLLYKRLLQFSFVDNPVAHQILARRPFGELVNIADKLAVRLSRLMQIPLSPTDLLIDAPPVKLEVQFQLPVRVGIRPPQFQPLGTMSPVVQALATQQFDSYVKKVRVFIRADLRPSIRLNQQQLAHELISAAE